MESGVLHGGVAFTILIIRDLLKKEGCCKWVNIYRNINTEIKDISQFYLCISSK